MEMVNLWGNRKEKILFFIIVICSILLVVLIVFVPVGHGSVILSPAEEYHGWQKFGVDCSLSYRLFGFGLNHKYVYFEATNGSIFLCEDLGWSMW